MNYDDHDYDYVADTFYTENMSEEAYDALVTAILIASREGLVWYSLDRERLIRIMEHWSGPEIIRDVLAHFPDVPETYTFNLAFTAPEPPHIVPNSFRYWKAVDQDSGALILNILNVVPRGLIEEVRDVPMDDRLDFLITKSEPS